MKIKIDTKTKTITLLESCKLSEVVKLCDSLEGDWNIDCENTIQLVEKIIERQTPYTYPWYTPMCVEYSDTNGLKYEYEVISNDLIYQ